MATRLFSEAKIRDTAYTYEGPDVQNMDLGWVADLEYFDDRDGDIKLTRKLWRLLAVDEITLPDPHQAD